jgi:predicted enzyme related to lactoylglutathione lyase
MPLCLIFGISENAADLEEIMNGFCHIEIPSKDLEKAKAFYEGVFGWKVSAWEGMENYLVFETGDGVNGGFTTEFEISKTAGIMLYIQVEDIPGTLGNINKHGGKTILPKTQIPNVGYYAIFSDAEGNQLGLFSEK